MIFSLVAMIGLEKCCLTSACLQWLCHSGERIVARGPLVSVGNAVVETCHDYIWFLTIASENIVSDKACISIKNGLIFFLFLHANILCGYSVEAPW